MLCVTQDTFQSKESPWCELQTAVIIRVWASLGRYCQRDFCHKRMYQPLKLDATKVLHEFGLYCCYWEKGISTVPSCLASAPGRYLPVPRQEFSSSVWEGGRTSFSSIHLLWLAQRPWDHPFQVLHVKNYHPNTGGRTQTPVRSGSPRSEAWCPWQWGMTRGGGDLDCIQRSPQELRAHSGPLLRVKKPLTGNGAPWTRSLCQGHASPATGAWRK